MTRGTRRWRIASALVLGAALVASSCSSGDDSAGETTGDGGVSVRPASIAVAVPDLTVYDLQAGVDKPLRSLLGGEQPILFWFWAPH